MKKLLSSLCSSGWRVHVHTADTPSAGTDSDVYIRLYGDEGEMSAEVLLDNRFRDDFERGSVDSFDIAKKYVESFTHNTRITKIELWMSNFGPFPDWNLDRIVVENKSQRDLFAVDGDSQNERFFIFPVFRWIKSERHYKYSLYDTSLPQIDPFLRQREVELEEKQQDYEYSQPLKDRGLDSVLCRTLPSEEMLPFEARIKIISENVQGIVSTKMTTLLGSKYWKSIESLKEIFLQSNNHIPEGLLDWASDKHFGSQRITGCNSELIERLQEIPENLPVTDDLLQPVIENMTIREAIEQRRLFICDYKILQDIKPREDFTQCVPISLFFVDKNDIVKPVAIQLFQDPGTENPIFTSCDHFLIWNLVKMWLNNADAIYHQSVVHMGSTHIIMEGISVNTHRNLSISHPIFKLLAPHFAHILPSNSRDLQKLIGKGGLMDSFTNLGSDGMLQVINRHYHSWHMDTQGTLPEDLKRRGVADPNVLPGYHFRDDALLLYDVISDYVKEYCDVYYTYPALLTQDVELQNWAGDLTRDPDSAYPGLGLKGVPGNGELSTTAQLCQILTSVIFTCSAGHAAAHFKQYAQCAFPLNCPMYLAGSPPQNKTATVQEDDILSVLPDRRTTLELLHFLKGQSQQSTRMLGDFENQYVCDPRAVEVVERFRQRLRGVSATVKTRNLGRSPVYEVLDPDNVPISISG